MRETSTHIYFWGSYLSNWYKCTLKDGQYTYQTSESYLMAHKAFLFGDVSIAEQIIKLSDPKKQKALGRKVKGFKEEVWNTHKFDIMVRALMLKFTQNQNLKNQLLDTGDKILVEASPYDNIWGIGLHYDDDAVLDETKWQGQNLLGKALMDVRTRLRKSEC